MTRIAAALFTGSNRHLIASTVVLAAMAAVLIAGLFVLGGSVADRMLFLGVAAGAAWTVLVAIYTGRATTLYNAHKTRRERAQSFEDRWAASSMGHVRVACLEILQHHGLHEDTVAAYAERDRDTVLQALYFFEEIAFLLEHSLIDEARVRDRFGATMLSVWEILKPWIDRHRAETNRGDLWRHLEAVARRWR